MDNPEKNRRTMQWIWEQMRKNGAKGPPDRLILEGQEDLAYLYQSGFVDTERYSFQDWINAFRPHRQQDARYELTLNEWLEKAKFRYAGTVSQPFDPNSLRNGQWTVDEFKQIIKEKIAPETVIPYELFYRQLEKTLQDGLLPDKTFLMDASVKKALGELMDKFASPRRRRSSAVEKIRQTEELEGLQHSASPDIKTHSAETAPQQSHFQDTPDRLKQDLKKLGDLLSGGKK